MYLSILRNLDNFTQLPFFAIYPSMHSIDIDYTCVFTQHTPISDQFHHLDSEFQTHISSIHLLWPLLTTLYPRSVHRCGPSRHTHQLGEWVQEMASFLSCRPVSWEQSWKRRDQVCYCTEDFISHYYPLICGLFNRSSFSPDSTSHLRLASLNYTSIFNLRYHYLPAWLMCCLLHSGSSTWRCLTTRAWTSRLCVQALRSWWSTAHTLKDIYGR